jgi:hypothetical protein
VPPQKGLTAIKQGKDQVYKTILLIVTNNPVCKRFSFCVLPPRFIVLPALELAGAKVTYICSFGHCGYVVSRAISVFYD